MNTLSWTIPFFPLIGALINAVGWSSFKRTTAGIIATTAIGCSFLVALLVFRDLLHQPEAQTVSLLSWFTTREITISFSLLFDQLSVLMALVVSGVGFLIHLYSIGYMKEDKGFNRFFAYLNLFVFFMLLLVLADNYLMMFIGWEGVGLCSYLLIGFWFKVEAYNNAAKKAFIMNRIGDLGFLLAMFLMITQFHTLNYSEVNHALGQFTMGAPAITAITLLLFLGATGKSAQIPLYTWLPDAMAGPTPVSALIHAATMVTAGIYMIARSHVLFMLSPVTMGVITTIGVITALMAGSIAMFQNDIKKILAYSTISQLGFMFAALGVGAFTAAMFHLTTHAFFKALLFLGAGSIIHALGGEQDIRKMHGLREHLPKTFAVFLIGSLAISGIPPLSGFFSKDMILIKAFEVNPVVWGALLIASLMTAFYMARLVIVLFFRPENREHLHDHHLHESPNTMIIPMVALAFLSVIGGALGIPHILGGKELLSRYFAPIFTDGEAVVAKESLTNELMLMALPLVLILGVILLVYRIQMRKSPEGDQKEETGLKRVIANKYYVDEHYDFFVVRPLARLSALLEWVDRKIIDRAVVKSSEMIVWSGKTIRYIQNGNVGGYLLIMVLSIILMIFFNLFHL